MNEYYLDAFAAEPDDFKPVFEKTISQVRAEERCRKHPIVFVVLVSAACARHKDDWRVSCFTLAAFGKSMLASCR